MPTIQAYKGTLTVMRCGGCGVTFGMEEAMYNLRVHDHKSFYCPNGCCRYFTGETEEERLRQSLQFERNRADSNYDRLQRERASKVAVKGHVTRLKKRLAAGKCPCCRAEFLDLAGHMATEHPDYAA